MLATQHSEVDATISKYFDVHHCLNVYHPEEQFDLKEKFGLCFEFDYPDRPGLELMRSTKERFPHLPVFMITAQHQGDRVDIVEMNETVVTLQPVQHRVGATAFHAVNQK